MDLGTISPIRYSRQEAPQEAQLGGQSLVTDYQSLFGEQTRKRSTTLCRGTFRFLSVRTSSESPPLGLRSSSLRSFGATGNHLCFRNSPQRLCWMMLINIMVHSWNLRCPRTSETILRTGTDKVTRVRNPSTQTRSATHPPGHRI